MFELNSGDQFVKRNHEIPNETISDICWIIHERNCYIFDSSNSELCASKMFDITILICETINGGWIVRNLVCVFTKSFEKEDQKVNRFMFSVLRNIAVIMFICIMDYYVNTDVCAFRMYNECEGNNNEMWVCASRVKHKKKKLKFPILLLTINAFRSFSKWA